MEKSLSKSLVTATSVFLVGVGTVSVPAIQTVSQVFAQEQADGDFVVEYVGANAKEIKGQVIPGSTITVMNERTQAKATVDADDQGNFVIDLVSSEFEIKEDDILNFTAATKDGQTLIRDVKVEPIADEVTEEITQAPTPITTTQVQTEVTTTSQVEVKPIVISEATDFVTDAKGNHTLKVEAPTSESTSIKGTSFKEGIVVMGIENTGDKVVADVDKEENFELTLPQGYNLTSGEKLKFTSLSDDIQTIDYIEVTVG